MSRKAVFGWLVVLSLVAPSAVAQAAPDAARGAHQHGSLAWLDGTQVTQVPAPDALPPLPPAPTLDAPAADLDFTIVADTATGDGQ